MSEKRLLTGSGQFGSPYFSPLDLNSLRITSTCKPYSLILECEYSSGAPPVFAGVIEKSDVVANFGRIETKRPAELLTPVFC
jgi:hypothetical protein